MDEVELPRIFIYSVISWYIENQSFEPVVHAVENVLPDDGKEITYL